MIPCRFCSRSRRSIEDAIDHLVMWHELMRNDARRIVVHPDRPIPDWLVVASDERVNRLTQKPLGEF